jgi:hypothetical protein
MNMPGGFKEEYDMKIVLRQYNIEKNETCIIEQYTFSVSHTTVEDTMHISAKFLKYITLN